MRLKNRKKEDVGEEGFELLIKKSCDGKSTRNGLEGEGQGSHYQGNRK